MSPDRWRRISSIVDAALDLALAERDAYLTRTCGQDDELRCEAERLLAAMERSATADDIRTGNAAQRAAPFVADVHAGDADSSTARFRALEAALTQRYTLVGEVGRGGMATVYLADDRRLRRQVAIKVVHPQLALTLTRQRFLQEIHFTARLTHPYILPVIEAGSANDELFYVTPFVEGRSLRERLERDAQLPVEEAVRLSQEIAEALDFAHRHSIVHRDVKPENVLLEDGHAILADFGIARAVRNAAGPRPDDTLTDLGIRLGTPQYMSPEQCAGERELDGRSDIYAVGCVLYELLSGEVPFRGPTAEKVMWQHLMLAPRDIRELRPGVPEHIARAVARALEKSPADRFQTAAEFAANLRDQPPSPRAQPSPRRPARVLATTALMSAAVIGAGALAWRERTNDAHAPAELARIPRTVVAAVEGSANEADRAAVRSLIIAALENSAVIRPLSAGEVRHGLRRIGRADTSRLEPTLATELAWRGGIRTVVIPTLDRAGDASQLTISVVDHQGGTLASERAVAAKSQRLIEAVDVTVRSLRKRLGERPESLASLGWYGWAMTESLDAFRLYRRGRDNADGPDAAAALYRAALDIDPQFAHAWRTLGALHLNLGRDDSARVALEKALALPDRLSRAQRLDVLGMLAILNEDAAGAVAAYRLAEALDGNLMHLAVALDAADSTERSVEVSRRIDAETPFGLNALGRSNLVEYLAVLGMHRQADSVPGPIRPYARAILAASRAEWPAVQAAADSAKHILMSASAEVAQGRMASAMRRLEVLRDSLRRTGTRRIDRQASFAVLSLRSVSEVPISPLVESPSGDSTRYARITDAIVRAYAGDSSDAKRLISRPLPRGSPIARQGERALLEAAIARARRDPRGVIAALAEVAPRGRVAFVPGSALAYSTLAEAYEQRGQSDSAAIWYSALLDFKRASVPDRETFGMSHSFAHLRLARLHERLGQRERAREHARVFLAALGQPDPELGPLIVEGRRIARSPGAS